MVKVKNEKELTTFTIELSFTELGVLYLELDYVLGKYKKMRGVKHELEVLEKFENMLKKTIDTHLKE